MRLPPALASVSRRRVLQGLGATSLVGAAAPLVGAPRALGAAFVPVVRQPEFASVVRGEAEDGAAEALTRAGETWSAGGMEVRCAVSAREVAVSMHAPGVPVRRVHLRWMGVTAAETRVLGDAWERSYGDLAWLPMQPERVLPWYCLLETAGGTHGYGVRTGAGAFAFWQVDTEGISLWLDVRNGGNGVMLGDRQLGLARIVQREGQAGETVFAAAEGLCRLMAPEAPLRTERGGLPVGTIFGSNDWYYAYGKNTPAGILRDAELMRALAPGSGPRPFTVIDDGYQDRATFPDMAKLAEEIRAREVVPGVWIRPLRAPAETPAGQLLPAVRFGKRADREEGRAYDPTVPEARAAALAVVREARAWGYRLIKHDFTTWELLGQWGFQMGASPTMDGWSFHDRSQTNAEIIAGLYRDIRTAAGEDRMVLGCNTVGHLAAGIFDAQRTGDDVSGRAWERTRRMGVNTLAFRLPQHRAFFAIDADCVPITAKVPWALTEQWLRAVSGSGTVLLVSPEPGAVGAEQKRALRAAFAQSVAAASGPAVPQDWVESRTPSQWRGEGREMRFGWVDPAVGASPFSV